jgi:hypothetical protein
MKTLTVPIPDFNHTLPRVVVLGLAVAGLGLATWYGTRTAPFDHDRSFVEDSRGPPPNGYNDQTQPVVYRDRATTDGQCSQWDVSPQAMEAILQEMLRRGWKPPTQGEAIASIAPMNGPRMTAIDPNAPLPVFTRTAPPGETVAPEEGAVTDDPDPTATTPALTAPSTTTPATRPPTAAPSRPPAAQPPAAAPPRAMPPVATSPRPPSAQTPVAPRPAPATPPVATPPPAAPATPPATPPAEPASPADPA